MPNSSYPGAVFSALISQFLSTHVPGVVRTRLVSDEENGKPRELHIDVAAGDAPARVAQEVMGTLEARYMIVLPPEQVHARQTDELQLYLESKEEGRTPFTLTMPGGPHELEEWPSAAGDDGAATGGAFDFQRRRARSWYAYREWCSADSVAAPSAASPDGEGLSPLDDSDIQLERAASGDVRAIIVAHPEVVDVLVYTLILTLEMVVIEPSRVERRDLRLLQEQLFSEWLVLAAERLGLQSAPFDDFPDDHYKVGDTIVQALDLPLPLVAAPTVERYRNSSREEKREAMRDAVWFMVALHDHLLQPAYTGWYDPVAVEGMLLVAWLRLAAEFAGGSDEVILETLPWQGDELDELLITAGEALERLCVEQGLVEDVEVAE